MVDALFRPGASNLRLDYVALTLTLKKVAAKDQVARTPTADWFSMTNDLTSSDELEDEHAFHREFRPDARELKARTQERRVAGCPDS